MGSSQPTTDPSPSPRGRLLFVAVLSLVLGAVVAGVLLISGADEQSGPVAPPGDCVTAWNDDPEALSFGRHNRTFHNYEQARVARISAESVSETGSGDCVVIFPSASLDPEPFAAGEFRTGGAWRPLSDTIDLGRVDQIQSEAIGRANVSIGENGDLTALP